MLKERRERPPCCHTGVSRIVITAYPKPKGPAPDKQNVIAACKAAFDGIADALGINDREFPAPMVKFGPRDRMGKIRIDIEITSEPKPVEK